VRWCCGDPKVGCFKDIVDAFLEAICEEVKEVMYGMLLQPRRGFEVERGSLGASEANHSKLDGDFKQGLVCGKHAKSQGGALLDRALWEWW
jgi:hypothetical protein